MVRSSLKILLKEITKAINTGSTQVVINREKQQSEHVV